QHQYRPTALRDMCVQVTLPASISLPKQHELTYYMQRDGIVKSIGGLICPGVLLAADCEGAAKTATRPPEDR
ncbi:MAG: hypothetical protein WBF12_25575, partial [Bradyrhizobium sp.]